MVLAIKDAYIKAIGQPTGFDLSRIDVNIPRQKIKVDGESLDGWEFRLFKANLGSHKGTIPEQQRQYQVAIAIFRGFKGNKFVWTQTTEELDQYVEFFDVGQVISSVSRLAEYDRNQAPSALPPTSQIPLSSKSSMVSVAEQNGNGVLSHPQKHVYQPSQPSPPSTKPYPPYPTKNHLPQPPQPMLVPHHYSHESYSKKS